MSALAALLGIEKSSAHRLAATLAARGYLVQDPGTTGYVLHDKVFSLAGRLASRRGLQEHARKYLRRLAQETGETAHLGVRGTGGALLIDHEFGPNPVAVTTQWGGSEPYHCTAIGKALLAGLDKAELREVLGKGRLKRHTARTLTRLDELVTQCAKAAEDGIAADLEEFRPGMHCLAAPVYDFRGRIIAAIGISGPAARLSAKAMPGAVERIRDAATCLSRELGH